MYYLKTKTNKTSDADVTQIKPTLNQLKSTKNVNKTRITSGYIKALEILLTK